MNREKIIEEIKNNISLYKTFTCPDYPGLNIYVNQYKDILVEIFKNSETPYSLIYTDVNKLSVVNERYGKEVGDKTLYTLLLLLLGPTSPLPKDSATIRIGGDEFITFVPNTLKEQVQKFLNIIEISIERQKDYLYGSSLALGIEDSTAGNFEQLLAITENQIHYQKNKNRKKDAFLTQANNSNIFVDLPIPKNISQAQEEKWETLNTKINILIDNHLRDIRPSSDTFEYKVEHIQKDAKSFISAFGNLLEKNSSTSASINVSTSDLQKESKLTSKSALAIHSLFSGKSIDFNDFSEDELTDLSNSLNNLCESLIRDKHSGLLSKSYYNMHLADKLINSKTTYQAVYYSISGIRPSNTAYGYSVTDNRIENTASIIIDEFKNKREFNNEPFTFDESDCFFIDQNGGNYMALIPTSKSMSKNEIQETTDNINAHFTDGKDSTFKVATASYDKTNKFTIPFFVNSSGQSTKLDILKWIRDIYQVFLYNSRRRIYLPEPESTKSSKKPFVLFARKLKEVCNNNKDPLKVEYLASDINKDSIEEISNDCIQYYLNEIDDSSSIENKKFLMENVMLALLNHESFVNKLNKELLMEKQKNRRIFNFKNPTKKSDSKDFGERE